MHHKVKQGHRDTHADEAICAWTRVIIGTHSPTHRHRETYTHTHIHRQKDSQTHIRMHADTDTQTHAHKGREGRIQTSSMALSASEHEGKWQISASSSSCPDIEKQLQPAPHKDPPTPFFFLWLCFSLPPACTGVLLKKWGLGSMCFSSISMYKDMI